MARAAAVIVGFCLAAGCGGSDQSSKYAAAAATLAAGVAGAGVYRATTGGCWGQCLDGMVCDRASGRCVHVEEQEDPHAPHLVHVNCLPDEASCSEAPDAGAHPVDPSSELIRILERSLAVELWSHPDAGCASLAARATTLQEVLRTELQQPTEQRATCEPMTLGRRCTLVLERAPSEAAGELYLELRFELRGDGLVASSLSCRLAG